MTVAESDPTVTLEHKIVEFSATLTDDERTVLHEVLHLASNGSADVEGFALKGEGLTEDPSAGGEITFPGTFTMLGNLHVSLHTNARAGLRRLR